MVSFCCCKCREITFLLYGVYQFCLFAYVLGVNVNIVAKKTSQTHSIEFRCYHDVTNAVGKLVFDGSIERI